MPMCHAGREVPEQGVVTNSLIVEEEWGEIWRARHDEIGPVLFVAYTTSLGIKMFQESLPALKHWKDGGDTITGQLLPVYRIAEDTAVPYILAKDPGGPTLRELVNNPETSIEVDSLVRTVIQWVEAAITATTRNLAPMGITPDTLIKSSEGQQSFWCVLPVAPRAKLQRLMGNGRYTSPELTQAPDITLSNGDCYSIGWITAEVIARDWNLERDEAAFDQAIHTPKLNDAMSTGITSTKATFVDPNAYLLALKRWMRNDAVKESKKYKTSKKKGGKKQKASKKKGNSAKNNGAEAELPDNLTNDQRAALEATHATQQPVKKKSSGGDGAEMMQKVLKIIVFIVVCGASAVGSFLLTQKFL